ncbi:MULTISPECIES: 4,5-DOPA dioxygenase extradiol [Sphingobacterium]|uniref:4,5-DOPA dioxygenase extradiol n=1 Tax=Sphingobacterium kitahiroshimense TaxID=470446 RepID=A0ABV0BVG5_9SPHI|nr:MULTISPECIES: 4,5-DOPA dioxygenase extradiol [Sphingobacterium]MBB2949743.1 4,5-DOPA dioxygenase extradiol [Sphingobacterium sp. JUb56]MCS3556483.1 4,5-DOPA dioxygenase extradiol [Sphingobacterium sp. JUb21]MCW2263613.1 4,5-DOPA dioxygenase extradiol [Sphingobacterium kitahiroshimense]TCR06047.1 4,5-DOPA dioxygenase extradiol [Sphingobacterium sp. JUb78]
MNRKKFITAMAVLPLTGAALKVNSLRNLSKNFEATEKFPVLFLGHGSPMNAIEENEFVDGFRNIGKTFQKPKAILVISAHWETRGTFVTAMDNPPTIHDFGGFPQALFDVQYPAPGSPELAQETKKIITKTDVLLDDKWGLDHGAWSVVKHLYPDAEVPVIQMSIDYTQPASYHYELAQELASLRHKGVLIIGSGNMVHNLRMVAWDKLNEAGFAWDWAQEAKEKMKNYILDGNHKALIDFRNQGKAFDLAIPTPEHYLPMIYSLALKDRQDDLLLFNDNSIGGSLAMTSFKIG